jgi:ABC-type multidrug transport system ATPase subunit
VLFSGDDVDKKLGSLSGGEAARVLFARLAVEKPNVLLLDEPTNHLDVEAIRALAESLRSYDGTVLFVSHNRWFVSELATRIVEVKPNGIVDFPGGYDDYLARCGDDHLDADAVVAKKRAADASARQAPAKGGGPKSEAPPPSAPKPERAVVASGSTAARAAASNLPYEEIKRRRNRIKTLEKQLEKTTGDLGAAESRLKAIRDGWGEDGFYERTSAADIEKLQGEEKQLEERAMGLMMDWEQTETELGELKASLGEG